jgi:beta-glucosidase-like glycosyl hydrolase
MYQTIQGHQAAGVQATAKHFIGKIKKEKL